jgi:hypothetical protein
MFYHNMFVIMARNSGPGSGFVKMSALLDFDCTYAILIKFEATDSLTLC